MTNIRRTTIGNLALAIFVAFLLQVVMAAGGLIGTAHAGTIDNEQVVKAKDRIQVTVTLSPITDFDFGKEWSLQLNLPTRLVVTVPSLKWNEVAPKVYKSEYPDVPGQVYGTVYATVYEGIPNAYQMLLTLNYLLPSGEDGTEWIVDFQTWEWYSTSKTVYLAGIFKPPPSPEPTPAPTPPTTVPTDTGTVRIDPEKDEAVLKVDPEKVEAQLKDPAVEEIRLGIPSTVKAATLAVDIPPVTVTGAETYQKPLVAELGAAGAVELKPGTVSADDLKYTDERGVERQGNLRIAATAMSQEQADPLLSRLDRTAFGNQQPVAQVYEIEAQVVADGQVVGTAPRARKPLVLVLTFDKGKVDASGAPIETTQIYVLNEATQTWEVCASQVDPVTGKVTTKRPHLSKYTVMAYKRTFADIATHWGKADIEIMAGRLVARGMTPQTFVPDGKVTRAQFAAFLQRALGIPEEKPARATFSDVASGAWYYGAVEAAAKAGLVLGHQGKFRPDDLVTRQEMATMVVRGIAYDGKTVSLTEDEVAQLLNKFADNGSISAWARSTAALAVKTGIVLGRSPDQYAPAGDGTRAEAVAMIKRLLKYLGWF